MPPQMNLEEAVGRPGRRVGAHPGDAVGLPALHFHHVRHRMLRPTVARLEFDRRPPLRFGTRVVGSFLQAEGMHTEQRVVAGHGRRPGRQGAGDAVAQQARVADVEIDQMPDLQGDDIRRVVDGDVLQRPPGAMPVPGEQMADGLDVTALARIGRQPGRRRVEVAGRRDGRRLGADQEQVGLEHVRHDKVRPRGDGGVDAGHRVFDVALKLAQGAPVVGLAVSVGAGMGEVELVVLDHLVSLL